MSKAKNFVAIATRGVETALAEELRSLGISRIRELRGAVEFQGKLRDGYRALLWSRIASRILLRLGRGEARNAAELYDAVRGVAWEDHIAPERTIAVEFVGRSQELHDGRFGAMKTKDAIVDRLRDLRGFRPDVDPHDPDVPIHVHLDHSTVTISLDLAGAPLHLRGGGGRQAGPAPLRETLAAALLQICGWPARAAAGESFYDPFCGSGTLLLEAAAVAQRRAPALGRRHFGVLGWSGHEPEIWNELVVEAEEALLPAEAITVDLAGADFDKHSVRAARANLARFGLDARVRVEKADVRILTPPQGVPPGLVLANPPYGERLGDAETLTPLYRDFGDRLRHEFLGWHAGVLVADKVHAGALGLRPSARHPFFNGPIECRLLEIPISANRPERSGPGWRSKPDL
jgi:23S rRNA (guanine2445-N2)-methyltransferase / 23S rRNA (guanine2069-N7)-methyltransferase